MFKLREFFIEWVSLLLKGDGWVDRSIRFALLLIALGLWGFAKEPVSFAVQGSIWPLPINGKQTVGFTLALLIVIAYALLTMGAAWSRSSYLGIISRIGQCESCRLNGIISLEVWNRGTVRPIEDVHIYLQRLRPGLNAMRELGWAGPNGPERRGITLNAGAHGHANILGIGDEQWRLLIGPPLRLHAREYIAEIVVQSAHGRKRATLIIDPLADPEIRVKRRLFR